MATNAIDSSLYLSNYKPAERKTGQQTLGKDDFLKILIAQLEHQDPLNPMEDKEFISQMASFSSLEQMMNMSTMMQKFIDSQSSTSEKIASMSDALQQLVQQQAMQSLARYSELIGKKVEWHGENGEVKSAVVKAVLQQGTKWMLELDSGDTISASDVTKVTQP
jgi:flagellar basal-body rod modification protein FlgD